eukprot:CAMPEP_0185779410 /NCGR_PEP_ID=MMETSP1174-20130828/95765_1 /TAXON_ID=35687 /ORGANISM="Dictyocha speculum, Strain CCMP1381" /LENGTH=39 /DNA_ID= /DNA_START= /DNA_END= /DNA_ORIENTATION=
MACPRAAPPRVEAIARPIGTLHREDLQGTSAARAMGGEA